MKITNSLKKYLTGFGMLEVMIALFILSFGLMGLAALQSIGVKFNYQSYERTQAVFFSSDIIDRIRANRAGKFAGTYDIVGPGPRSYSVDCRTTRCTSTQLANYDIAMWKGTIRSTLGPTADAEIAYNFVTLVHQIKITWAEDKVAKQFITEISL